MTGIHSIINRFNLVKQIPIFNKLHWFELQKIARNAVVQEYKKGEIIRREGDPADYFYCLISGRLQAYTLNPADQKDNVEFIHRGMHFGIISVFTGENHSLNFEAINDSVVLKIDKDDFHALLKSVPQLAIEFNQSLSRRIRSQVKGTKSIFESTIISIYSPQKGTGSSTYAINLALNLEKETKKKVILVNIHTIQNQDDDQPAPVGETAPELGRAIDIRDVAGDPERIFGSISKTDIKIDVLNVAFDAKDAALKKQISPLVSTLVGAYHYVIVDLPNDMDDFVLETLNQSDMVHLVAADRRKDLELIRNVIERLKSAFKENYRMEKFHVIIRSAHNHMYLSYEEINKAINFNVYTVLPQIEPSQIKTDIHSKGIVIHQFDENSEYTKSVKRIARQIGGVMVGLVLGGGAALGVAHVGVIRVLEEENIPIDVVVGSSMGALIASLWAIGKNAAELEIVAREFEKRENMLKLFDPIFPIDGLVAGHAITRWLKKHLGNSTFYNTRIPLKIVAYDLIRREELVIEDGSLADAVRKSISIPGVIRPIKIRDQIIIDGGVLNPLPTNVLARRGIKKIIAVNVLQSPEDTSAGFDLEQRQLREQEKIPFSKAPWQFIVFRISRFFSRIIYGNISDVIVRSLQACEYVIAEQSAQQADVVIHPNLVGINWFELHRVDELLKSGEDATRQLLPKIKKLIEHSHSS